MTQLGRTISKAVHGLVRVRFMPNPKPTHRNRVGKKCTRHRPVGIITLGGSDHQQVARGSVGVIDLRRRRENSEKNVDLAKKPRFRQ